MTKFICKNMKKKGIEERVALKQDYKLIFKKDAGSDVNIDLYKIC